jgi:hypothetical protein
MLTLASDDIQNMQDGDFGLEDCSFLNGCFELLEFVLILLYPIVSIRENMF